MSIQSEATPLTGGTIDYVYDELARVTSRTVGGAGAEVFEYDALGRLVEHASDLGSFTFGYLGQTWQVTQRQLEGSTHVTNWSYLPNSGDRRLASISSVGLSAGNHTTFDYGTNALGYTTQVMQTSDAPIPYPAALVQSASYNNLNQLTTLSGQSLTYDANGNLLSDGARTFSWDAENRLIGITYPGEPGKLTEFSYDGLGRRVAISRTPPGGGVAVASAYLWCGPDICQARDEGGSVVRSYYAEGEYLPGSSPTVFYYGTDRLGSVRRAYASGQAPSYDFDPYGNALQSADPVTDFTYAGMLHNPDSGLLLATHRVYDPEAGRFLSRDPLGENTDLTGNLYAYVNGDPINAVDPDGLNPLIIPVARVVIPAVAAAAVATYCKYYCPPSPPSWPTPNAPRPGWPNGGASSQPIPLPASPNGPTDCLPSGAGNAGSGSADSGYPGPHVPPPQIPNPPPPTVNLPPYVTQSPTVNPAGVAGKPASEIDQIAKDLGLIPKGPDPMGGRGSYNDPVTGEQRILIHPQPARGGSHVHVNDPSGQRLDINGNPVNPESPDAHLPLG